MHVMAIYQCVLSSGTATCKTIVNNRESGDAYLEEYIKQVCPTAMITLTATSACMGRADDNVQIVVFPTCE